MSLMTSLKGYKTVIFNVAVALGPLLDYFANDGKAMSSLISDPAKATLAVTLVTAFNIVLRSWTNTALGGKVPAPKPGEEPVTQVYILPADNSKPLPKPDGEG